MLFLRSSAPKTFAPRVSACSLAFVWTLFLTMGIFVGEHCSSYTALTFSHISDWYGSFFASVLFRLIVLLFSLVFAHQRFYWGLLILAGCRGLGFGFLVGRTWTCFGNAGWLYCCLLYFSSAVCAVIELWLWTALIRSEAHAVVRCSLIAFVLELTALFMQSKCILPFIIGIIS